MQEENVGNLKQINKRERKRDRKVQAIKTKISEYGNGGLLDKHWQNR